MKETAESAARRWRILIVDDEVLARTRLRHLLADCVSARAMVVSEAANAADALAWLQRDRFDLLLLDIQMPGTDGMALSRLLHERPDAPAVVFVTAHAQHAVQAFEVEALDYLTKPVRLARLQRVLQKVELKNEHEKGLEPDLMHQVLKIQDRGRSERVPLAEVLYLRAELKYVTVRTAHREYVFDASLSELEQRFGPLFVRIHRNALVARWAIRALEKLADAEEGWAVRLSGLDELLAVSRRQLSAVRDAIGG